MVLLNQMPFDSLTCIGILKSLCTLIWTIYLMKSFLTIKCIYGWANKPVLLDLLSVPVTDINMPFLQYILFFNPLDVENLKLGADGTQGIPRESKQEADWETGNSQASAGAVPSL